MTSSAPLESGITPRVVLIGGTSDARDAAAALRAAGVAVLVSTVTAYGEQLAASDGADARSGALDTGGMAALAVGSVAIVDASHPFARAASEAARSAAEQAGVAYLRFEREGVDHTGGAVFCESAEEAAGAAVEAAGADGTVLLTVGSRTVAAYTAACRAAGVRCVARVLPTPEALAACADAGLSPADVVAMQGPTSAGLDAALLHHLGATVIVTKDSGAVGGVPDKLEAARRVGATAIVVARPSPAAIHALRAADDLVARVAALAGIGSPAPRVDPSAHSEPRIGLVHVYTGDGKGKTTASVGLAVRAAGAGLRVAFVQFVKGGAESSELESLRRLGVQVSRPAERSSGLMRGTVTAEDRSAARIALDTARSALTGPCDVVVLDEGCVAARRGIIDTEELVAMIAGRTPGVEVVVTGRGAPEALLGAADYVTEMCMRAHPFERGVAARRGVEF